MHVKRISAGLGKGQKFAVAKRGSKESIPLLTILRDHLGYADNAKEAKYILKNNHVQIDGVSIKDYRHTVGLMDIISIPLMKKNFLIVPSKKGLILKEISDKEAKTKLVRINGKKLVDKGKTQISLHDGTNIIYDKECSVNDTLVLSIPEREVKKTLTFKKSAPALIFEGRHSGETGTLNDIIPGTQSRKSLSTINEIQTLTDYVFITGDKKSEVTI